MQWQCDRVVLVTVTLHYPSTALHCTALHCTALHCTALHCTALHCTVMHCTALHCTALHCTEMNCTALHCTALHCTALHCTALHCTVMYCPSLTLTLRPLRYKLCRANHIPVCPPNLWIEGRLGGSSKAASSSALILQTDVPSFQCCLIGDIDQECIYIN